MTTLRDLYQYIQAGENVGANAVGGDAQGTGTNAPGLTWFQGSSSTEGGQSGSGYQFNPDPMFAQGVSFVERTPGGGAQSGGNRFEVDPSKFPRTRFGDVTRTAPVEEGTSLFNPRLVYDDPHYGRITSQANIKPDSADRFNSAFSAAALAGMMAGMGGLGMPSWATSGVNLARGVGSGQGLNVGTILGALGSAAGLPPAASMAMRMALATALRNRRG